MTPTGEVDRALRPRTGARRRAPRRPRGRHDVRAAACLAIGLLALACGLALSLSHAQQRLAGRNAVEPHAGLNDVSGHTLCQGGEVVPAGTAALRLSAISPATPGPDVAVVLRRAGRVLDRSAGATEARTSDVIVPIGRTARELAGVEVCLTFGTGAPVAASIGPEPPNAPAVRLDGEALRRTAIPIAYLRAGRESWWSYASTVAARIGLGRGDWGGRWIVGLVAVLVLGALALVVHTTWRTIVGDRAAAPAAGAPRSPSGLRRVPRLAWTIAAIAALNAAAWSFITPAFQAPDEPTHTAYAQLVAERGRPAAPYRDFRLAPNLQRAMDDLRFATQQAPDLWLASQQRRLDRGLHASLARVAGNEVGPSASEPPLYYALEAIPYRLASGATLLDQLALMRLLSALMAAVTALFAFLFVRECLPARPWTWTVGALGVALAPTLGFISGAVNPDALIVAIAAALFYLLAVAFRRGLTTRLAVRIGLVLAAGIVAKINFYGLVPGALIAVALAARASAGRWNREAARLVAIAAGIAAGPFLLLSVLDAALWERAFILARTPSSAPAVHGGLGGQLSYLWQVYLPRLPGQTAAFPERSPPYDLWLKGFVGVFGWARIHYAAWGYRLGAIALAALALLAARAALPRRGALRRRAGELAGYVAMAGGLLLLIGLVALRNLGIPPPGIAGAVQGRYVLPLLPLFGALLALAARGAGGRWARATGVAIVVLCVAWSLTGQLATIAYYYG